MGQRSSNYYKDKLTYLNVFVAGVSSVLNSATVTPRSARDGANMAAGYTTDDVPTCNVATQEQELKP